MLQEAKIYFDQMFKDDWTETDIHYAGEEFDSTDMDKWINISLEPVRNNYSGIGNSVEFNFTLYVVCWGDNDTEVMGLGDKVSTFINANVDTSSYSYNGYEIVDRNWQNSNSVYMVMGFRFKTYGGECS